MCLRCSRGDELGEDDFVEIGWLGRLSDWTFAKTPAEISLDGGRLQVIRWELGLVLKPPELPSLSLLSRPLSAAEPGALF